MIENNLNIMVVISIISIIVCIFNIILFFKVWRACNDVHALTLKKIDEVCSFEEWYLAGDDEQAYAALNESFAKQIMAIVGIIIRQYGGSEKLFKSELNTLLEKYRPKYMLLGKNIPDRLANVNFLDLRNIRRI